MSGRCLPDAERRPGKVTDGVGRDKTLPLSIALMAGGIAARTVRQSTNISEALLTAVIRATGIALLPGWMVSQAVQRGDLVRVLPDWRSAAKVSVYALMPPGTLVPAKTRVFIDTVCQQLASSPLWQDELKR